MLANKPTTTTRPVASRSTIPRNVAHHRSIQPHNISQVCKSADNDSAGQPAADASPPSPSPTTSAPSQSKSTPERGVSYYTGLLTSDIKEDNKASSADMLGRSLQLAGGVAGLLGLLVVGFMASNGLL